ncbi:GDSL-type esterase/lipase family protein [Romboutsia hominis]|uniref:GDSL-type esterase/lipase family protein n=1 Tax=Romboutsia hominis TaxID=1507512 RepID=UPI001F051B20|nr:GDSL-type esterase/lipase family protein [Romboutsia hominis]MCH1961184.1 GDSL-type esterase/lipase family protein [Romboutsia hominis]MCH1968387.1 GDSL-type esterase/lipase family protein [Romboutsia hominis]
MKRKLNKKRVAIATFLPLVAILALVTVIRGEMKNSGNEKISNSKEISKDKNNNDNTNSNEVFEMANSDKTVESGVKAVKRLESKNITEIQEEINDIKRKKEENESKDKNKKVDYSTLFENSVIMGDSRAEGLTEYEILSGSSVVAYKGRTTVEAKDDVSTVVDLSPSNVIMTYGMNDLELYSNPKDFIKSYEKLIKEVQSKLPSSKIYLTSIFPVQQKAINKQPMLKNLDSFNIALENMCSELGIRYINVGTLDSKYYEPDGIHFLPSAYKLWLNSMVSQMNL